MEQELMTYVNDELARIEAKLDEAEKAIKQAHAAIALARVQLGLLKPLLNVPAAPVIAAPSITVVNKPEPKPAPEPEAPLTITPEWQAVLDELNNGADDVFITGGAGTGKSTLLNHFVTSYRGAAAIVAPTGVAALRISGQTIHSFFGFGAHALSPEDVPSLSDSRRAKYKALDMLIIDEISMVRADLMDAIDRFLRLNGRDSNRPFGGCRLVMIGDLFQLPPVSKEANEKKWLMQRYGTETPYFFHAEVWRHRPIKICNLTTIFRQKDETFTNALNAIRKGAMTADHLKLINSRVNPLFVPPQNELWLTLTTTNASADQSNQKMLKSINAPAVTFEADVVGDFDLKNAPTDEYLELKPGAAVMFIRNDPDGNWVNGTMGRVVTVAPLEVEVNGTVHEVEPVTWESIAYDFDEKARKLVKTVKGKFIQIPLKLAAAITVHKSQGLSLDRCIIDLGHGAFASGQAYVGLSRCRSLEGMVLRRPLRESDLITSTEVQAFMAGKPIARPAVLTQQAML